MEYVKQVNVIRHLAFEDLGSFSSILMADDYQIRYLEAGVDKIQQLDPLSDDLLVVLGGPISVNDASLFPVIDEEIAMLQHRITADKPTLGICLGAQMIAVAAGARVYPGEVKEIGWYDLQITDAGEQSALRYLDASHCRMLHWHGETFDLPPNATLLALSELYYNQAFSLGENVLALQFHPEVTLHGLEQWFIGHIAEISATEGVSVPQLRADTQQYANQLEIQGELFFKSWLNKIS